MPINRIAEAYLKQAFSNNMGAHARARVHTDRQAHTRMHTGTHGCTHMHTHRHTQTHNDKITLKRLYSCCS